MAGVGKDLVHRAEFDDLAQIHHRHTLAEEAHDRQIVRDEELRLLWPLAREPLEHAQDLRLHADIERRGWLVEDQQVRVEA